jgi:hypothetical protein
MASASKKGTTKSKQTTAKTPSSIRATALFGDQRIESTADNNAAGLAEAFPFAGHITGRASSVKVYIDSRNHATSILAAIYANKNGQPGALLTTGKLASPKAGAWNAIPITSKAVHGSNSYWLAVMGKGGAVYFRDRANGPCTSETSRRTGMASLPSAWASGIQWSTCPISAYAAGTATASATSVNPPSTTTTSTTTTSTTSTGPTATTAAAPLPLPTLPIPPVDLLAPQVTGTTTQGQTLTTDNGTWLNNATSFSYQWRDCDSSGNTCANISGATSSAYTLTANDIGHTMRVIVTATNAGGSTAATSNQTTTIAAPAPPAAPANTVLPSITGTTTQGQTLTTSNGSWSGSPTGFGYQWRDCNTSGASCTNITGATSSTYTLTATDVGDTLRAVVTATNAGGSTAATSNQTTTIVSSGGGGGGGSQTCSKTFTSSTWSASAVQSAGTGGQTLCLSSGTYSDVEFDSYHPSSNVTIQPASGASVNLGRVTLTGVSNLTVTGFGPTNGSSTSSGLTIQGQYNGPDTNITWSYNSMPSAGISINTNPVKNANIQIAHNRFVGYANAGEQDRLMVNAQNGSSACPAGIDISYNLFSGGESDGTDVDGNSCGVQILHNEYSNIQQGNCGGIHCDAIQDNGGGAQEDIEGNYFHNNSDGLLFDDGNDGPDIVANNVFDNPTYRCLEGQYGDGTSFTHNTFDCEVNLANGPQYSSNITMRDNVFGPSNRAGITYYPNSSCCSFKVLDYNLHTSGAFDPFSAGSHDAIGSPTYVGGTEPSTYAGWALASGSLGVGKASDGTNMGAAITTVGP